ncbi:MAG: glycosyltransferase family 4 protein [Solirubrobacteraceae bacterium]
MLYVATPYGRKGPSSRVRVHEWLERIHEGVVLSSYLSHRNSDPAYLVGHATDVVAAERRLRRMAAARPERLLLHREASPLSRGALERRLLRSADLAVYDFDDALQWDWGEGGLLRRFAPKAPKATTAVLNSDRVIAGNPVLADWASGYNRDVVVIPSCVDPSAYTPKTRYELHDPPRIGWIGSRDNELYLRLVAPALYEAHRRTGARVLLIGTVRRSLGDLERIIDRMAWSEETQRSQLTSFDVGIAPLPDEPYTRGKCGYRLLQYAAAGVPAVGSPVGVNGQILGQLGGLAPENGPEWADALTDLLERPAESRAEIGRRSREIAQLHYSYDAWLSRWREALGLHTEVPAARGTRPPHSSPL